MRKATHQLQLGVVGMEIKGSFSTKHNQKLSGRREIFERKVVILKAWRMSSWELRSVQNQRVDEPPDDTVFFL